MDVEWIRQGLKKPGKSQRGLAAALNLDPAAITRLLEGKRQLKAREVPVIEAYLDESAPPQVAPVSIPENARRAPVSTYDKIPVLGIAEGGEEGWSLWNGDIVDYVTRPPALAGATGTYAVFVTGMSMEPRYYPGEMIYIHPGRPVTIGSFVLIQTRPHNEGEPPRAIIARLEKRTTQKLVVGKLNPARQIEVAVRDLASVHRIVASGE